MIDFKIINEGCEKYKIYQGFGLGIPNRFSEVSALVVFTWCYKIETYGFTRAPKIAVNSCLTHVHYFNII